MSKHDPWGAIFVLSLLITCAFGLGHSIGRNGIKLPACPPCEAQPFCQYMGSPVGGRMAQLPEGVGPHD